MQHHDIRHLATKLAGDVLDRENARHRDALTIDNGRISLRPLYVMRPRNLSDIQLILRFARNHKLELTVKGGGHGAAGYCLNEGGIVLDLSLMNAVTVDIARRTAVVQMGARWRNVYEAVIQSGSGLIPVGGGCVDVGVAGFILGGGYSFVSRSYGLGIDNVLAMTVVTADGVAHRLGRTCQDPAERELFWACLGGGGGNFGVAVDAELQLHRPQTPTMLIAEVRFRSDQAHDVLAWYNEWIETVPNALAAYGIWRAGSDPVCIHPGPLFGFTVIYNGDIEEGVSLLRPLLAQRPLHKSFLRMSLPEFELGHGQNTNVAGASAYMKSGILPPRALSTAVISECARYVDAEAPGESFIVWTHAGGRISEVSEAATAYAHRKARLIAQVKTIWRPPDDGHEHVRRAHDFFSSLATHFTGSYVNYIDPLLRNWPAAYYGANYARLCQVKKRWDPQGFFRSPQSIGAPSDVLQQSTSQFNPLAQLA